jgi:hypothetical protein
MPRREMFDSPCIDTVVGMREARRALGVAAVARGGGPLHYGKHERHKLCLPAKKLAAIDVDANGTQIRVIELEK